MWPQINLIQNLFKDKLYTEDILKINNIQIPNFFKDYCNHILPKDMMAFEFNHLIEKIFFTKKNLTFYENKNFQILKDDIVFDCGGNMGLFAAAIAHRCKQIYSFEPMSLIRKNLYKTASLYNNIIIIPVGLWKENKIVTFWQKDNPGASRAIKYQNPNQTLYKEQCSLITIDDFVFTTGIIPNFIKVDIENSEIELLEGAQECLKKYAPKISIALHFDDEENIKKIKQLLPNYKIDIYSGNHGLLLQGEKNVD